MLREGCQDEITSHHRQPAAAVLLFLELFSVTSDYRFWIYGAAFLLLGALGGIATGLQCARRMPLS